MKKIFLVICLLILLVFSGYSQACLESGKPKDPEVTVMEIFDVSSGVSLVKPIPSEPSILVQNKPEELDEGDILCEKPREGDEYNKPTPTIPYWVKGDRFACNHTCNCACPLCLINRSGKPLEDKNEGVNYNGYAGINLNEETGLWPNKRGYDLVYKWPTYNSGSFLYIFNNMVTYYKMDSDLIKGTLSIPKRGYDLVLKYPIYNSVVLETLVNEFVVRC